MRALLEDPPHRRRRTGVCRRVAARCPGAARMEGARSDSVVVDVVPAKAGTHSHRRSRSTAEDDPKSFKQYTTRRMGPRFRGDDVADCFGHHMTSRLRPGIIAAVAVLALDQASKLWLLYVFDLPHRGAVKVAPFLDLVLAWNVGISFGWFQSDSQATQIIPMIIQAVAPTAPAIWMARSRPPIATVALGLIIGGALGHAIDPFPHC